MRTLWRSLAVVAGIVIVLGTAAPARSGQGINGFFVIPHGPARAGVDVSRFDFTLRGAFDPFVVTDTTPLRDALQSRRLAADTDLLLMETATGPLALVTEQMAYHHIAQGRAGNRDWLVSFCVVCNTGTRLTPIVGGTSIRFQVAGVYNGMLVMQDAGTGTIWDHLTGEALYGPSVGATIGPPGNVLQMAARQVLKMEPDARVAISDRVYVAGGQRHGTAEGISLLGRVHGRPLERTELSDAFAATLGSEDARRPRMDLGLGIWSDRGSRYYPRDLIRAHGGALIDRVDDRALLVYLDEQTSTPTAMFVTSARATVRGSTVRLDDGQVVREGMLFDARGRRLASERPQQVFTRWYGFALTFPGTTVYGETTVRQDTRR